MRFSSGTYLIRDGSDFDGGINVLGATLNFEGLFEVDDLSLSSGTLNLDTLDAGDTFTVNNSLSWSQTATNSRIRSLGGNGILSMSGLFTISGDRLTTGIGGTDNWDRFFNGITLNILNGGSLVYATGSADNLNLQNGAVINILSGGVLDLQTTEAIVGTGTINNSGTILKNSAGTTAISSTINFNHDDGTIDVQSGTLSINNDLNWNGGIITGAAGANLTIGGLITIGGSVTKTLDALTLAPANLTVGGTGILDVNGGTLNVAGTTTIDPGATLRVSTATFNPAGTLNNNGILDLDAGTLSLGGGGTHTGDFDVAMGTTLQLNGGTHTLNIGSDTSGAGDISFTGGTSTYNTGSSYSITGETSVNGGDVNFNIAAVTNSLAQATNTLGGTGSLTTTGWTPTTGITVNINSLVLGVGYSGTLSGAIVNGVGSVTNQGALTLDNSTLNTNI